MGDQISVLVVEDEPFQRISIAFDLEDAGFNVLEASDADEAIDMLSDNPHIRVLFTDVDMPDSVDGLKLAAAVRDRWKIIVTSAHRTLSKQALPVRESSLSSHTLQTASSKRSKAWSTLRTGCVPKSQAPLLWLRRELPDATALQPNGPCRSQALPPSPEAARPNARQTARSAR
jgi:CheY-like chemotaxis protein